MYNFVCFLAFPHSVNNLFISSFFLVSKVAFFKAACAACFLFADNFNDFNDY